MVKDNKHVKLRIDHLSLSFGGVQALIDVSVLMARIRDTRHYRTEWRRQDHHPHNKKVLDILIWF